jgi:hypothetical protein
MIPKPQQFDSAASKEFSSFLIAKMAHLIVMSATIEFDRQLCARTIEIDDIRIDGMLAPEFITGKISIPEMAP